MQISFITNTAKNNLEYTKLLLRSLKENLDNPNHQIIVFVDSDNENTLEWLLSVKDEYTDLMILQNNLGMPTGYQRNKTLLTEYAKYDIVSYLQSDMVIGPHYDTEILRHVAKGRILSATRVEPPLHGESPVTVTKNFGLHPDEFDMSAWNTFSSSIKRDELIPYFFAPITYYKEDWMRLGGYDTVFRRSREDSDLVQRCVHAGIELIQTFSANVYHFTCVSSRGKDWFNKNNAQAQERVRMQNTADQIELRRFIRKWGNFNHGTDKLFKLDIDLDAQNINDIAVLLNLEPYFSRVWVASDEIRNILIAQDKANHAIANELLSISTDVWESRKHLFRLDDISNKFQVGPATEYSIKVSVSQSAITSGNAFLSNIHHMYDMLKDYDAGEYELDGVRISINKIVTLPTPLVAQNPEFDYTLLTVYQ